MMLGLLVGTYSGANVHFEATVFDSDDGQIERFIS